jgi:hypothetical protein
MSNVVGKFSDVRIMTFCRKFGELLFWSFLGGFIVDLVAEF